ncbi:hypothetical protein GGI00_002944, partial [Coemansia sp. RSA 2681]
LKAANGGVDPPGYKGVADGGGGEQGASTGESKPRILEEGVKELPEQRVPIVEDEKLPTRMRYGSSRPKAPPQNYLTHPRTHMHVGSGQPATTQGGRSAKKKPTKTTTAAKSTTGSKSTKKK